MRQLVLLLSISRLTSITVVATIFLLVAVLRLANATEFFCASGNVTCLVAAINNANTLKGKDTINLQPGIYTVNTATGNGTAGLPSISSSIRIQASGDDTPTIIRRDLADPFISVLDIFVGGELTLKGITVQAPSNFCEFCAAAINNHGITTFQNSIVSDSSGRSDIQQRHINDSWEYHRE